MERGFRSWDRTMVFGVTLMHHACRSLGSLTAEPDNTSHFFCGRILFPSAQGPAESILRYPWRPPSNI
jgi:hypothetical protein